jgi:hypothetical protein
MIWLYKYECFLSVISWQLNSLQIICYSRTNIAGNIATTIAKRRQIMKVVGSRSVIKTFCMLMFVFCFIGVISLMGYAQGSQMYPDGTYGPDFGRGSQMHPDGTYGPNTGRGSQMHPDGTYGSDFGRGSQMYPDGTYGPSTGKGSQMYPDGTYGPRY